MIEVNEQPVDQFGLTDDQLISAWRDGRIPLEQIAAMAGLQDAQAVEERLQRLGQCVKCAG